MNKKTDAERRKRLESPSPKSECAIQEALFDNSPKECEHLWHYTLAEVPGGLVCLRCGFMKFRSICYNNEPEKLGYISATWAWKHKHGRNWTDDTDKQKGRNYERRPTKNS